MLERLSPKTRNLALAALGLIVVWFSWTVRAVLNPVILGYLLAFVLNPMVQGLESRGWKRRSSANAIFLAFFLLATLTGLAVFWQGRALVRDIGESDSFQNGWSQVEDWASDFLAGEETEGSGDESKAEPEPIEDEASEEEQAPSAIGDEDMATIERLVSALTEEQNQARAIEGAAVAWPYLRSFFGSLVALATLLALLPIYAYFLLFELDRIHAFVYRYIPKTEKDRFSRIGRQIGEVLASFFRGRLLICVLKGAVITLGLWIVGVPYAVFLGMGSGFLSLVPFVGPMVGFTAAFALASFPPGGVEIVNPDQAAWVPLVWALVKTGSVFVIAELLEGYVFLPKVLGDSLGLHPVVVLASIFIGGAALGMFGFLIALPLTAALVIIGREMVLPAMADFADEDPPADDEDAGGAEPAAEPS